MKQQLLSCFFIMECLCTDLLTPRARQRLGRKCGLRELTDAGFQCLHPALERLSELDLARVNPGLGA
jgi:hypothetical protein